MRFCVPSCNERSIRRSSTACASSAAARVAVSSATRRERSTSGPAARNSRPGRACSTGHAGGEPEDDDDPAQAQQTHGDGFGPGPCQADPQGGGGRFLGQEPPVQRKGAVPHGEDRQEDSEHSQEQAQRRVPDQPAQVPSGGGVDQREPHPSRRGLRGDDLRTPAGEPRTFVSGQGMHRAQHNGRHEQPHPDQAHHGGDGRDEQHQQGEQGRAEPGRQLPDRGAGGAQGADDGVLDTRAPVGGSGVSARRADGAGRAAGADSAVLVWCHPASLGRGRPYAARRFAVGAGSGSTACCTWSGRAAGSAARGADP